MKLNDTTVKNSESDKRIATYVFGNKHIFFINVLQNRHGYYLTYQGTKLRTPRLTSLEAVETLVNSMKNILKLENNEE